LRSSKDDVLNALRTTSEIGMVAETPDGRLGMNFKERQEPMTPAKWVRGCRK